MILYKEEWTDHVGEKHSETCIWYSPGEIIFNYDQNIWLIENILPLDYGEWAREPLEHGESQRTIKDKAYYVAACEVMSIFRARIKKLPQEPKEALIDEVQTGIKDYKFLSRTAKRGLAYISGEDDKKQSYAQWKAENKRKNKNHKSMASVK